MRLLLLLLLCVAGYSADPQLGLGPAPVTTAAPSGAAGGDLGGTYPNPTVVSVADITTGILPAANGGSGIANTGTLTYASNTTITGGGTLALGGFTLTVPATGTAALLATANAFTAAQTITAANGLTVATASGSSTLIINAPTGSASILQLNQNGANACRFFTPGASPGGLSFNDQINSTTPLTYAPGAISAGIWSITNTTASTTTGTGALVISGGLGVGGEVCIATGNLNVTTSTANGSVASVLAASTGPTGASTTETGWITIKVAGTNHYIPYWDVGMHPTWSDAMAYCNGHPRAATLGQVEDEMAYVMDIR